jgi:molybdopterin converting factor small subunit
VADLVTWLAGLDQRHAAAFKDRETVRCAVNQEFADSATTLRPGDEVAFFPPVTGG